jgi:hypothetical protein
MFEKSGSNKVAPTPPHADPLGDSEPGSVPAQPEKTRQWLYNTNSPMSKYCVDRGLTDECIADWWKRCSGLHTVEDWVCNYKNHPAGWAALLTIQGIPEVTGRLRHKVENYAIYSALFLSFSVPTAMDLPTAITECDSDEWSCVAHKRLFVYLITFAIATHMLCILLSMSFVNALNQAARDADVYRLFGRGQGFSATVKTQNAFRVGCIANFAALAVVGHVYIGWDIFAVWAVLVGGCLYVFASTSNKLFETASIVEYWREELGGKPDPDDPYDLRVVMELFRARAAEGRNLHEATVFDSNSMQNASGANTPQHHLDHVSAHRLPKEENLEERKEASDYADRDADKGRLSHGACIMNCSKIRFLMVLLQAPSLRTLFKLHTTSRARCSWNGTTTRLRCVTTCPVHRRQGGISRTLRPSHLKSSDVTRLPYFALYC